MSLDIQPNPPPPQPALQPLDAATAPSRAQPVARLTTSADAFDAAQPQIDPRIAGRVSVDQRTTGPNGSMDVAVVRYQDDANGESGGNHDVYVRILDAPGRAIPPDQVSQWFDVRYDPGDGEDLRADPKLNDPSGVLSDAWTTSQNTGAPTKAYFNVDLWGSSSARVWVAPKSVAGNPYAGFGSQSAGPFTMPGHHHVNYLVTFQPRAGSSPAPQPQPAPPPAPAPAPQPAPGGAVSPGDARAIASYAAGRGLGGAIDNGGGANAHAWLGMAVQDFAGGAETEGKCMVVAGPNGPKLVRNGFYGSYVGQGTAAQLGAPLEEEHWEGAQVVQRFQNGELAWTPQGGVSVAVTNARPAPAPAPAPQPLGDLVESVYQSELGRASDPAGKANWVWYAGTLRAQGRSDAQVRSALVAKFDQSAEYLAKHAVPQPPPAPPPPPGGVGGLTNVSHAGPTYHGMFDPMAVTPGFAVPTRLGAHFGPLTSYQDDGRIASVVDRMAQMGIGYSTVIVDGSNPAGNDKVIAALKARGIEPVVRFVPVSNYNMPMSAWTDDDFRQLDATARHLASLGVKAIQMDNEPNLEGLPRDGAAFESSMDAYAANARRFLATVRGAAPGMSIGLPPTSPANDDYEHRFYTGLLSRLAKSGESFDRVFLATHPYDTGGQGSRIDARYRQWALEATGRTFTTLATEGGNPRNGTSGDVSWGIHQGDFQWLAQHPGETQCLWIIADGYLTGNGGTGWENDALVRANGGEDPTLQHLRRIWSGQEN